MIKGNVHENVFSLIFSHDSKAQEAIIIKKLQNQKILI